MEAVRVAVRVRPLEQKEEHVVSVDRDSASVFVSFKEDPSLSRKMRVKERNVCCKYDQVFGPDTTQKEVFDGTVKASVKAVLEGINATVFAYGQTGTGKTYTIIGEGPEIVTGSPNEEKRGVLSRAVIELFDKLNNETTTNMQSSVLCSYLQIYNEKLFDLMQDQKRQFPLRIRVTKSNSTYVQGLSEIRVSSLEDVFEVLRRGAANRAVRATEYNEASSRSHAILQLRIETEELKDGISESRVMRSAKLNFVDLAGSEKWAMDNDVRDERLKEMMRINTSLSSLGNVIQALGEKRKHVPYRDSVLTHLLQDSLGGNTRTTIICTLSPSFKNVDESISTLQFADRAKQVMVSVKVNEVVDDTILLARAQAEIARLRRQLRQAYETGHDAQALREENKQLIKRIEALDQDNKDLREQNQFSLPTEVKPEVEEDGAFEGNQEDENEDKNDDDTAEPTFDQPTPSVVVGALKEDLERNEREKLAGAVKLLRKTETNEEERTTTIRRQDQLEFNTSDLGKVLEIFQCRIDAWYAATVVGFDPKSGMHCVNYKDSNMKQWHQMEGRTYKILRERGPAATKALLRSSTTTTTTTSPRHRRLRMQARVKQIKAVYNS